jgi:hypothetical protein
VILSFGEAHMTTVTDAADSKAPGDGSGLPASEVTGRLVRTTALAVVGAAAAVALVLVLVNRADWWRGLLAASVVTVLSAAASFVPLAWGLRRGLYQATAGSFAAMGVRAAVALGGGVLVVKTLGYPAAPTLLLLVVFYFAVLAAETYVIAWRMWHMRG